EKGGFSGPVIFRAVSDRLKDLSPEDRNAALRKLVDEGQLTAFVDAGGRMWDPESYAKMLAVTVQSRVYAEGNMDRQLANGIRMGVITGSGLKADALCGPWRRMIVAYDAETAREYRLAQLSELPSGGPPFHPWCQDQCLAIDPATVSKAALEESSARRDRYESLLGIGHGKAYREAAAALGL
ncbi:MAG: phage minor capsid protein, partial [Nocardioides sp.]